MTVESIAGSAVAVVATTASLGMVVTKSVVDHGAAWTRSGAQVWTGAAASFIRTAARMTVRAKAAGYETQACADKSARDVEPVMAYAEDEEMRSTEEETADTNRYFRTASCAARRPLEHARA